MHAVHDSVDVAECDATCDIHHITMVNGFRLIPFIGHSGYLAVVGSLEVSLPKCAFRCCFDRTTEHLGIVYYNI